MISCFQRVLLGLVSSLLLSANHGADAFLPRLTPSSKSCLSRYQNNGSIHRLQAEASSLSPSSTVTTDQPVLTSSEQTVYEILEHLHASQFAFRFVVVGNGAILESTATIPVMKLNKSPQTGENLITLASTDQSFEFHLKTIQVSNIVFSQREQANGKTLRIIRFLKELTTPMTTLILADNSDEAAAWYDELQTKYGTDVQLV